MAPNRGSAEYPASEQHPQNGLVAHDAVSYQANGRVDLPDTAEAEDPETHSPLASATMTSSIANLTNTIIGTGMLATPGAFKYTGILLGVFLIFFCGFTAAFGLYLLTRCAAKIGGRKSSFFSLSMSTLPACARGFDAAIALKCYGVSISYLIICGQLMPQVIISFFKALHRDVHEIPVILLDRNLWILILMILLVPLCFLRKLDSLRHTSYLSLAAVFILVCIVIYYYVSPSAHATLPPRGDIDLIRFDTHVFAVLPIFIFAYTCAQNVFPVYNELKSNTEIRVNRAIAGSLGTGCMIYLIVAVLGYLTFGDSVADNVITMYPSTSIFVCIGRMAIVVLTLFSYPLQIHPCRASLDKVFSFSSHSTLAPEQSEEDSQALLSGGAEGTSQRRRQANVAEIPLWKWCTITAFLLSSTFVISLLVDDLGIVLGFVGSVGSTTISFILPGILYAVLHADERNNRFRRPAMALAAWGIVVMIISLSANIYKLRHAPALDKTDRIASIISRAVGATTL